MKPTIIEIKAKCENQNQIRETLLAEGAEYQGTDHQVDTYFYAKEGRLKLREGNIENNLIHYSRENKEGPKQSNVILYKSNPDSTLKEILEISMDKLVVVDKKREIYFIKNVKFHIDNVNELGTFVEIEAIDINKEKSREELLTQCQHYLKLFKIPETDLISVSYSDLLMDIYQ